MCIPDHRYANSAVYVGMCMYVHVYMHRNIWTTAERLSKIINQRHTLRTVQRKCFGKQSSLIQFT